MSDKAETTFDIEALFTEINDSFTKAAVRLKKSFDDPKGDWADSPYVYHMPKMQLSMRLSLTHTNGKLRGFFRKKSTEREESVVSTIDVEVVAVPNPRLAQRQPTQDDGD